MFLHTTHLNQTLSDATCTHLSFPGFAANNTALYPSQDSRTLDPDSKTSAETMTTSSGATGSDRDAGADGAAPYGTRSRNRGGNSRPNYAEDKDIEMDNYEYYDKNTNEAPKKSSRLAASTTNADAPRAVAGPRKPLATTAPGDDSKAAQSPAANSNANSNGQTAGAGAASSSSSTSIAASRKRKATNVPATQPAVTAPALRRTANTVQNTTSAWPDSNMLTFDNCKSRPQNGRMVADDGTVLEANGNTLWGSTPVAWQFHNRRLTLLI